MNRVERFSPFLTVGLVLVATPSLSQSLYKYQDENGVWVYSDRQPSTEQSYEVESIQATLEVPEIVVTQRETSDGLSLIATSSYYGPVQLAYQLSDTENIAPDTPSSGRVVLPGRSQTELLRVVRQDDGVRMSFDYRYQHIPGDPAAQHLPTQPYRLPYSAASSYRVSQAYPDFATHQDPASQYAIDFEMPIGTPIHAVRDGVVIDVASDFYQSGTDVEVDGPRANVARVLHDDGTMSVYAHLNWNSIRVVPGQFVGRGEYIADSGNTGFSTGPHLHFVVQRNADGSLVSVPVEFAGPGGSAVTLSSGDRPTAY